MAICQSLLFVYFVVVVWSACTISKKPPPIYSPKRDIPTVPNVAASAIEDILVTLVHAHSSILKASIRGHPWYIRVPLYLYRRHYVSISAVANSRQFLANKVLSKNITLLQTALVEFLAQVHDRRQSQQITSIIVSSLNTSEESLSKESEGSAPTFTPTCRICSTLIEKVALRCFWVRQTAVQVHRFIWREYWRMHMRTMMSRRAATPLDCIKIFLRAAATSFVSGMLASLDSAVQIVQNMTVFGDQWLDDVLRSLVSKQISVPSTCASTPHIFLLQIKSLFRMLLVLSLQVIRLLWTLLFSSLTIFFLSTLLIASSVIGFWWPTVCHARNVVCSRVRGRIESLNINFQRLKALLAFRQAQSTLSIIGGTSGAEHGDQHRSDQGPSNAAVGRDMVTNTVIHVTTSPDGDGFVLHDNIVGGLDTDVHEPVEIEPAECIDKVVAQKEPQPQTRRRMTLRDAPRSNSSHDFEVSDGSSVVFVGHIGGTEKENIAAAVPTSRSRLWTGAQPRDTASGNPNTSKVGSRRRKDARLSFAMRLLDINTRTARQAQEAVELVCGESSTEEQVRPCCRVQTAEVGDLSTRITRQSSPIVPQPSIRRFRRRVPALSDEE